MNGKEQIQGSNTAVPLTDVKMHFPPLVDPLAVFRDMKIAEREKSEWSCMVIQPDQKEAVHIGVQRPGKDKGQLGIEFKVQHIEDTDISSMDVIGLQGKDASTMSSLVVLHKNAAICLQKNTRAKGVSLLVNESPIYIAHDEKLNSVVLLIRIKPDQVTVRKTSALTNPKGTERKVIPLVRPDEGIRMRVPHVVAAPEPVERHVPVVEKDEAAIIAELKEKFIPHISAFSLQALIPGENSNNETGRLASPGWLLSASMNSSTRVARYKTELFSSLHNTPLSILKHGIVRSSSPFILQELSNAHYAKKRGVPNPIYMTPARMKTEPIPAKGFFGRETFRTIYDYRTLWFGDEQKIDILSQSMKSALFVTGAFSDAYPKFSTNSEPGMSNILTDVLLIEFNDQSMANQLQEFGRQHAQYIFPILHALVFQTPTLLRVQSQEQFHPHSASEVRRSLFSGPAVLLDR